MNRFSSILTFKIVSICHCAFGAYFSAEVTIFDDTSALNSVGQVSRKSKISRIVPLTFCSLINAKHKSTARRRIDGSGSFKQSRIVDRWRCTELKLSFFLFDYFPHLLRHYFWKTALIETNCASINVWETFFACELYPEKQSVKENSANCNSTLIMWHF